ncbi:MAG: class I SAM-dependent methyltransferase [Patescibacteria group bacterium]
MFSDPAKNVRALGLNPTAVVVDLGAGTGFYAVAAGHLVPHGKVYAVEVQKDYLEKIRHKAKEAKLRNIEAIWGNIEKVGGTKLRDAAADAAIVSNVLFQVEDKEKFLEELRRILKPGGKVLLIDWSSPIHGGRVEHIVPKAKARAMFEEKGFALERELDAGSHHYGMILVKR